MPQIKLQMAWYRFICWFCRGLGMLFFRWRFYGTEKVPAKGAFLLVCNHQSFLDPVLCAVQIKRQLHFMARDTLFHNWFFGPLITSLNSIPLKRGQSDMAAMRKIIDVLRNDGGVLLFPEGTRSRDGKISPFKAGLGLLCRRGNAAIVPVVIDGAFESWPRNKKIFTPGGLITTHFGEVITAEQIRNMADEELAKKLTETLRQMQHQSRIEQGKEPFVYDD